MNVARKYIGGYTMKAKIATGSVATVAPRPVWDRAKGWRIVDGRVAAESPEAAASFAADLVASFAAFQDRERARPAPDGTGADTSGCKGSDRYACAAPVHGAGCHPYGHIPQPDPGIAELAARYRAMRGVVEPTPAPVIEKTPSRRTRTARKPKVEPIAPVVKPDSMDACERCGRTDWRTPAGRAWHVENNPDCAQYRKPGKHQYAA